MIKEVDALSKQVDELVVEKLAREKSKEIKEEKENEQENFEDADADADAEEDTEKEIEEQEKDYFLLERKHNKEKPDDAISDIPANQIYTGALENDGEVLELRDANNNLIDKVGCIKNENQECKNWFAGNRENRISMERINPILPGIDINNWASNNLITRNG